MFDVKNHEHGNSDTYEDICDSWECEFEEVCVGAYELVSAYDSFSIEVRFFEGVNNIFCFTDVDA